MPGRKPKPAELKVLQGDTRPDRMPQNTPKPQPIAPKPPSGLPASARKVWKTLGPHLESLGLLTAVDGPAFTMLCLHYGIAFDAIKEVSKGELQTKDENNALRKHPLLQVFRDNSNSLRQWATEFGLTPSSRARLSLPDPEDSDDFFDW